MKGHSVFTSPAAPSTGCRDKESVLDPFYLLYFSQRVLLNAALCDVIKCTALVSSQRQWLEVNSRAPVRTRKRGRGGEEAKAVNLKFSILLETANTVLKKIFQTL